MKLFLRATVLVTAALFLSTSFAVAGAEKDPLKARVPADKRGAAKKNENRSVQESEKGIPRNYR